MFNKSLYHQLKSLIGNLEGKLEMVDQDLMSSHQLSELTQQVEDAWQVLCRRENKRGPYARRAVNV